MNAKMNKGLWGLILLLTLVGCIKVYSLEVQQGNVVNQDMVDKLRPGMTRNQVRAVLGSPLITDAFHQDRWDYFYSYTKGKHSEARRLAVIFDGDALARIEGDVIENQSARPAPESQTPTPAPIGTVATPPASDVAAPL